MVGLFPWQMKKLMQVVIKQLARQITQSCVAHRLTVCRLISTSGYFQKQNSNWGSKKVKRFRLADYEMDPQIEEQLAPFRVAVKEQVRIYKHIDN